MSHSIVRLYKWRELDLFVSLPRSCLLVRIFPWGKTAIIHYILAFLLFYNSTQYLEENYQIFSENILMWILPWGNAPSFCLGLVILLSYIRFDISDVVTWFSQNLDLSVNAFKLFSTFDVIFSKFAFWKIYDFFWLQNMGHNGLTKCKISCFVGLINEKQVSTLAHFLYFSKPYWAPSPIVHWSLPDHQS